MKAKPSHPIRDLRKIIGQTQSEFAAMIGASKDAVASWEIRRNPLSRTFARRIALATGVEEAALRRARGPLTTSQPLVGRVPFTAETFARHRSTYWGRSDEQAARQHFKHCADALGLLFFAAARTDRAQARPQLPAVVDSFIQWCEQTRADFDLEKPIDEQLAQRAFTFGQTHPYGQWRNMARKSPAALKAVGFKDDPTKSDTEQLFVGAEACPAWTPGACMKGPRPARTRMLRLMGRGQ